MNIKNLLLAVGITLTTAGTVLNTQKETIRTNAINYEYVEYLNTGTKKKITAGTGYTAFVYSNQNIEDLGEPKKTKIETFQIYYQDADRTGENQIVATFIYISNAIENISNLQIQTWLKYNNDYTIPGAQERSWYQKNNAESTYIDLKTLIENNSFDDLFPEYFYDTSDKIDYEWKPTQNLQTIPVTVESKILYGYYTTVSTGGYVYQENDTVPITPYNEYMYQANIGYEYTPIYTDNTEIVDIGGMMLQIISMPFTFISTAFNLTLFPGTQYQINIGRFILGLIAVLTVLFIIKIFTGGLDIVGGITQQATTTINKNTERINANRKLKTAKTRNQTAKEKSKK